MDKTIKTFEEYHNLNEAKIALIDGSQNTPNDSINEAYESTIGMLDEIGQFIEEYTEDYSYQIEDADTRDKLLKELDNNQKILEAAFAKVQKWAKSISK